MQIDYIDIQIRSKTKSERAFEIIKQIGKPLAEATTLLLITFVFYMVILAFAN